MAPDDIRTQLALLAISVHEEATVSETVDRVLTFARQAVDCSHAGVVFIHSRRRIESVAATDEAVHTLEHTVALSQALPNTQLCVVPNEGHGVLPEQTLVSF